MAAEDAVLAAKRGRGAAPKVTPAGFEADAKRAPKFVSEVGLLAGTDVEVEAATEDTNDFILPKAR